MESVERCEAREMISRAPSALLLAQETFPWLVIGRSVLERLLADRNLR